jgi:hypothetical protein
VVAVTTFHFGTVDDGLTTVPWTVCANLGASDLAAHSGGEHRNEKRECLSDLVMPPLTPPVTKLETIVPKSSPVAAARGLSRGRNSGSVADAATKRASESVAERP